MTRLAWVLLLTGCSSRGCSSREAAHDAAVSSDAQATSGMALQIPMIEANAKGDPCEARVGPLRRTVAAAIDRRWSEIDAYGAALGDAAPYRRERLGTTYVRVPTGAPPASGWTTRERSWDKLGASLDALPERVDERWLAALREARALLVFDLQRTAGGAWKNGTREALGPQAVTRSPTVAKDGASLVVRLDPGDFDAAKELLAAHVEDAWKSGALSVKVRWTTQAAGPSAYRFSLGTTPGAPSYVSSDRREIVLNPDVRARAIAHEVGHVLGLSDRYVKRYDGARCLYTDEIDAGDLMSDPDGAVTAEEFSLLAKAYGT